MAWIFLIIGIVVVIAGVLIGFFMYRKNSGRYTEMKFQQTTPIRDVVSVIDEMYSMDPTYHHYCEIKGTVQSDAPVIGPFSGMPVAYYSNRCYSVTQQVQQIRDKNGNYHTITNKVENQVSSEASTAAFYVMDQSSNQKIYVDAGSFGGNFELMQGCDRFEPTGSQWMNNNAGSFNFSINFGMANLLGYHLVESILPQGQQMYLLGEVYRQGDRYVIGESVREKKPSAVSYRSEDEMEKTAKNKKIAAIVIMIAAAVIGGGLIAFSFTDAAKQLVDGSGSSYSTYDNGDYYNNYTSRYYNNNYYDDYAYNGYGNNDYYYYYNN